MPWCAARSKTEVMEILGGAGVPAGATFDTQELMNDPHLRKRGMFVSIEHPVRGEVVIPGWPVKMSDSKVEITTSPLLGEHTEEIYGEMLGLEPEKVKALRQEGVV